MQIALLLFTIPFIIGVFSVLFFKHKYTLKEFGIQIGVGIGMAVALAILTITVTRMDTKDIEILNGQVVSKEKDMVSCEHSYSCNCRTVYSGTGNNRTSQTICDTCYEHSHDFDWVVKTTVGRILIDRVNRQGTIEPSRYKKVKIGEPASVPNSYTNYVKAVPDSIFNNTDIERYNKIATPSYPKVYDYYRFNHVINQGALPSQLSEKLNKQIAEKLRTLGKEKQVNIIFIALQNKGYDYAEAIRHKWLNGKKNDVVIIININNYPKIKWVKSFGWSNKSKVFHRIESEIKNMNIEQQNVIPTISAIIKEDFKRKPFEDFKYLLEELEPPIWLLIIVFSLNIIVSLIIARYFVINENKNKFNF